MKYFSALFFCVIFLFPGKLDAQNAFNDATTYKSYMTQDPMNIRTYHEFKLLLNQYKLLNPDRLKEDDPLEKPNVDATVSLDDILVAECTNPFFKANGQKIHVKDDHVAFLKGVDDIESLPFMKSFSTGASASSAIILGIGKFLADRTKEELTVTFFTRFRKFLNMNPEIGLLFPTTVKYLNTILNTNYSNMLSTLRAAFESDIKAILGNIATMASLNTEDACAKCTLDAMKNTCKARLGRIQDIFKTDVGRILIAGFIIADGAINKKNPADMLAAIAGNPNILSFPSDVHNSLELLDIFSTSLRSTDPAEIWVKKSDLRLLLSDAILRGAYLGFIYQSIAEKNIVIHNVKMVEIFNAANVNNLQTYLQNLLDATAQLTKSFKELKKQDPDVDPTTESVILAATRFAASVSNFLKLATEYRSVISTLPKPPEELIRILTYTDSALAITQKLLGRDYYGAMLSITLMLEDLSGTPNNFNYKGRLQKGFVLMNNQIISGERFKSDKKVAELFDVPNKDTKTFSGSSLNFLGSPFTVSQDMMLGIPLDVNGKFKLKDFEAKYETLPDIAIDRQRFFTNLLRYGNFMSDVVSAKTPEDVEKALETMALPPGSSSIKKHSNFNIAIQAYTGVAASHTNNSGLNPWFSSFGVYAPVGISFSTGLRSVFVPRFFVPDKSPSNMSSWGSLTLFLSVIDVGAVVAYEFQNPPPGTQTSTDESTDVNVTWANIFAPGASIIYGIPGIPLSVGFGGQYQAQLQKYNSTQTELIQKPGFRLNLFLAFDIPVINLYNSKN